MDAPLVNEGPHHAVFLKPAGMTVVAGRGVPRPTLLDVAQQRFPGARPVHRLDRVTTGLTVVAKTPFGQQALSEAFRRHLIDKRYLALVEGAPAWDKLDIDARLARVDDPDAQHGKKKGPLAWQTVDPAGVRALTRVKVLARGTGVTLVEARPETGRMHQIRCHLASVGHPILGDSIYGATQQWFEAGGIPLLALAISFPLPHGGRAFVATSVPATWARELGNRGVGLASVDALVERFTSAARATPRDAERRPSRADPREPARRVQPKDRPRGPTGVKQGRRTRSGPRR